mmetsp:Transcript_69334/g.212564  ORF Transcript_69334/g.212564 Transcript_69334/m.212564 type:complete len:99 (-) Transcript_69334:623-919(-)
MACPHEERMPQCPPSVFLMMQSWRALAPKAQMCWLLVVATHLWVRPHLTSKGQPVQPSPKPPSEPTQSLPLEPPHGKPKSKRRRMYMLLRDLRPQTAW